MQLYQEEKNFLNLKNENLKKMIAKLGQIELRKQRDQLKQVLFEKEVYRLSIKQDLNSLLQKRKVLQNINKSQVSGCDEFKDGENIIN